MIVAFSVAYTLAKNFDVDGFMSGLISMISFFILTPYDLGEIGPLGQSFSIRPMAGAHGAVYRHSGGDNFNTNIRGDNSQGVDYQNARKCP